MTVNSHAQALKALQEIPGVGKRVAQDLWELGITSVEDLNHKNPEVLYLHHNDIKGSVQDICMLYTFRCAVYFAVTPALKREPQKLKWWFWTDKEKLSSKEMDKRLRDKYRKVL